MRKFLTACLMFVAAVVAQAKVELPPIFADNMVLQQQSDAAIWGKATPGSKVVITTTWSKAKTVVKAGEDGKCRHRAHVAKRDDGLDHAAD